MTDRDKIEHELPDGDILEQDATEIDPKVEETFRRAREQLDELARRSVRELNTASAK